MIRPRSLLPLVTLAAAPAFADIALNPLFTDGAVLQRDTPVPVWGTATRDGESVTVTLGDRTVTTVAKDGRWRAELPAAPATGTPLTLTVKGDNTVTVRDVLLGEVWVCSGQSNMEWKLKQLRGNTDAATANDPQLRMFTVQKTPSATPSQTVSGKWLSATPDNATDFSAVAYHFGKALRPKAGVPVGLIVTAWGGSRVEAWMTPATLDAIPCGRDFVQKTAAKDAAHREALARFEATKTEALAAYEAEAAKAKAEGRKAPKKPEAPRPPMQTQHRPSLLRHGMLTPLMPYAFKGALWYQGESNNDAPGDYLELFPAMVAEWRRDWGRGDFPFLFVQIAPFQGMRPEIREAQLLSLGRIANSAMVVTTDVGDAKDIHPVNKRPVGERLALAARALAYGEKLEYSGPLFANATFADGKATVRFTHLGGGLATADGGPVKGFTLAGADGKFTPATARLVGDTVEVTAEGVTAPTAVRYGWANVPEVNLANKDGLPASPFRSDVR